LSEINDDVDIVFPGSDAIWSGRIDTNVSQRHTVSMYDTKLSWQLTLIKSSLAISYVKLLKFSDVSWTICPHPLD
jgi:hypothetical protein